MQHQRRTEVDYVDIKIVRMRDWAQYQEEGFRMSDLSREKLDEFLGWVSEKGLMKQATARTLRSACKTVLAVMDDDEARDVSSADLQAVIQRYQNLSGMAVNPSTMQTYERRVKQAVGEVC